jgi:hypothetical protein
MTSFTQNTILLKTLSDKINALSGLTPHAEGVREWMANLPEPEYWHIIEDVRKLYRRCDFIVGSWGIGSTFELYCTHCVNRVIGFYSPKKVRRKREWRKKADNEQ